MAEEPTVLECPQCQSRFRVGTADLGATGRRVKCGQCGYIWWTGGSGEAEPAEPEAVRAANPAPASDPVVPVAPQATPTEAEPDTQPMADDPPPHRPAAIRARSIKVSPDDRSQPAPAEPAARAEDGTATNGIAIVGLVVLLLFALLILAGIFREELAPHLPEGVNQVVATFDGWVADLRRLLGVR